MSNAPNKFHPKELVGQPWEPKPVTPPAVDPQLQQLLPLTRSAESIVYTVLSFEFWISPNGQVREWLRHNARLAVILATPVFLVLPIITFALWQIVSWLTALTSIAGKLIVLPILGLIAVLVIYLTAQVLKIGLRK
jgi:hypothetical protein